MNIITTIQAAHIPAVPPTTKVVYPSPEFNAALISNATDFLFANPSKSLEDYAILATSAFRAHNQTK